MQDGTRTLHFRRCGHRTGTGRRIGPKERLRNLLEEIESPTSSVLMYSGLANITGPTTQYPPRRSCWPRRPRRRSAHFRGDRLVVRRPVRVFQHIDDRPSVDGRAEIMAGRGSFINPSRCSAIRWKITTLLQKLEILLRLREQIINWPGGKHTPPISGRGLYPQPGASCHCGSLSAGPTIRCAGRALGLPLAFAIVAANRIASHYFQLYRDCRRSGEIRRPADLDQCAWLCCREHRPGLIMPHRQSDEPSIGRERGWPPTSREQFDAACGPRAGCRDPGGNRQDTRQSRDFRVQSLPAQMAIGVIPMTG